MSGVTLERSVCVGGWVGERERERERMPKDVTMPLVVRVRVGACVFVYERG